MHDLQRHELIIHRPDRTNEEQTRISAIDNLGILVFYEITHLGTAREDELGDVFDYFGFGFRGECYVPF